MSTQQSNTVPESQPRRKRRTRAQVEADKARAAEAKARAEWVNAIADPAQRALARALPDVCAIFGVHPNDLVGRPAAQTPAAVARGHQRPLALGAVACLGRALGITWNGMHARNPATLADTASASPSEALRIKNMMRPGNMGSTEVHELKDAHRASLANAAAQFAACAGLDGTPPQGELGELARVRYHQILRAALAEIRAAGGEVVARTGDDD